MGDGWLETAGCFRFFELLIVADAEGWRVILVPKKTRRPA
jgi:hypothetical protein